MVTKQEIVTGRDYSSFQLSSAPRASMNLVFSYIIRTREKECLRFPNTSLLPGNLGLVWETLKTQQAFPLSTSFCSQLDSRNLGILTYRNPKPWSLLMFQTSYLLFRFGPPTQLSVTTNGRTQSLFFKYKSSDCIFFPTCHTTWKSTTSIILIKSCY